MSKLLKKIVTEFKKRWRIILVIIGLTLRLLLVFNEDFWEDELWSYYFAGRYETLSQHFIKPIDDLPPLYYPLISMVPNSIMNSDYAGIALRSFSFFATFFGFLILYFTINKLNRGWADVWLVIWVFSLELMQYSWQARVYGIYFLFCSLLFSAWIDLLLLFFEKKRLMWQLIKVAFFTLLCGMSNYIFIPFATAVGIALTIITLFSDQITKSKLLKILGFFYISIIPIVIVLSFYLFRSHQLSTVIFTTEWIPRPTILSLVGLTANYVNLNNYFFEYPAGDPKKAHELLFVNAAVVLLLGVFIAIINKSEDNRTKYFWKFSLFVLIVVMVHIGGIYLISIFSERSYFIPRFFESSALLFLIWLSMVFNAVLQNVATEKSGKLLAMGIASIYVVGFFLNFSDRHQLLTTYPPDDRFIKQSMTDGQSILKDGDLVVFIPIHYQRLYPGYYFHGDARRIIGDKITTNSILPLFFTSNDKIYQHQRLVMFVAAYIEEYRKNDRHNQSVDNNIFYYDHISSFCKTDLVDEFNNSEFKIQTCSLQ